jgi:hypothetical protein
VLIFLRLLLIIVNIFSFVFGPWSLNVDVFHLCLIIARQKLVHAGLKVLSNEMDPAESRLI